MIYNGQDKNKSNNKKPRASFQVNLIGIWRGGGGRFIKNFSGNSNVQHRVNKGNSGILVARIFLSVFQPMGSKSSWV